MLDELIVIVEGYNFYFFFQRNEVVILVSLKKLCFFRSFGVKNNFVYLSFLYIYYRVYVMLNN